MEDCKDIRRISVMSVAEGVANPVAKHLKRCAELIIITVP